MKNRFHFRPALATALLTLIAGPSLAQTQAEFESCLNRLQPAAQRANVQPANFTRFTQGVQADFGLLEKLNHQPEFKLPIWDYLSGLVDEERVADGQAGLLTHAERKTKIQADD